MEPGGEREYGRGGDWSSAANRPHAGIARCDHRCGVVGAGGDAQPAALDVRGHTCQCHESAAKGAGGDALPAAEPEDTPLPTSPEAGEAVEVSDLFAGFEEPQELKEFEEPEGGFLKPVAREPHTRFEGSWGPGLWRYELERYLVGAPPEEPSPDEVVAKTEDFKVYLEFLAHLESNQQSQQFYQRTLP